jgi:hypothetical protein
MTACSTDSVIIKNIPFVGSDGSLEDGELVVSVESSQYNLTSLRDAMIQTAALSAQKAATGKNCYSQDYDRTVFKRSLSSWWPSGLSRRISTPEIIRLNTTFCNTVGFAGVNYYNPWWRLQPSPGASDFIDARWSFQVSPLGLFDCELLQDFVDVFALIAPEFAVEDVTLGDVVDLICENGESEGG